jgi:site-specific recombinase XerD
MGKSRCGNAGYARKTAPARPEKCYHLLESRRKSLDRETVYWKVAAMSHANSSPPPARRHNEEVRTREELYPDEVARLQEQASKIGRYGHRDATMIMLAFGHGLRASELLDATWDRPGTTRINLEDQTIYVKRRKGSRSGEHDLRKCEVKALKKLAKDMKAKDPDYEQTGHVFRNERGGPLSESSFHKIVARAGLKAGIEAAHPHQLRHACGYKMINDDIDIRKVQVWMGHKNIQNTTRYAELHKKKLKGLWTD